jgi:hypothetical protein
MENRVSDSVLKQLTFAPGWLQNDFTETWKRWLLGLSILDWWNVIIYLARRTREMPNSDGGFVRALLEAFQKNWDQYGERRHWFLSLLSDIPTIEVEFSRAVAKLANLTLFEMAVELVQLEGPIALQNWIQLKKIFPTPLSGAEMSQLLRSIDSMSSPLIYQDLNDIIRHDYAMTMPFASKPPWMLNTGDVVIDQDFSTRGPAHPAPGESPNSAQARMFECVTWEEDSEDDAMANDWFLGYCRWDYYQIYNRKCAMRIPRPEGGFEGCFCSEECAREVVVRRYNPPEELRNVWITEKERDDFAFESSVIYRLLIDRIVKDLRKFGVLDEGSELKSGAFSSELLIGE